jgi:cation:H+ antiporter
VTDILVSLVWVLGLAVTLYSSEKLVHFLTQLGAEIHIRIGLLGLLVALGADAPEVTSALIATARGSTDVGLGVILGSNIYNLAGLLGLSAIVAGRISTNPYRLTVDGGMNLLLTIALVGLIVFSPLHLVLGLILLLLLAVYAVAVSVSRERVLARLPSTLSEILPDTEVEHPSSTGRSGRHTLTTAALIALSVVFILIGSDVLVNTSLTLGSKLSLPSAVTGTFVLAVATSLPNTWAAISLARRGLGAAAVAATFSSNSINAALGAGLPSLAVPLHLTSTARAIEGPWLLVMTAAVILRLATGRSITRRDGFLLLAVYAAFVAVFLASLR